MREQLFTAKHEKSGNGQERREQLFIARRETELKMRSGEPEKRGNGEEGYRP